MPLNNKLHILCAAAKTAKQYYCGFCHADIFHDIILTEQDIPPSVICGFLDSDGEFRSRTEAAAIAFQAGQTSQHHLQLHSEHINYHDPTL